MSTENSPVSDPPQHDPPLGEFAGIQRFVNSWMQWFLELKTKVNVINDLVVNFSKLSGTGFPALTGSSFNIRSFDAGRGLDVINSDGSAGNPKYSTKQQIIAQKADLPAAVAGVIQLLNNTQYIFLNSVDLTGDSINCGTANSIVGSGAANTVLQSTGLVGTLITGTSSLSFSDITLIAATGTLFNLNDGANGNLLFETCNIVNTPTIGTIQNYANIVFDKSICSNSANLTIDGNQASFVAETSLFDGRTGQTTIIVPATATFTRRFRMLYCAFIVNPGETGINFSTSATIQDESYILDNTDFTGGGTYIAGLDYTSNKSLFFNNKGITNSSAICQYSMTGNPTTTVIAATGTFVKIAGTTVASALNQKFTTGTTQRGTYAGSFQDSFRVNAVASMTSGNNQAIRMRIAKNGVTLSDSQSSFKTTGSGEASAIPAQTLVTLVPTDYIEIFVANDTAVTDILVADLNVIIIRI